METSLQQYEVTFPMRNLVSSLQDAKEALAVCIDRHIEGYGFIPLTGIDSSRVVGHVWEFDWEKEEIHVTLFSSVYYVLQDVLDYVGLSLFAMVTPPEGVSINDIREGRYQLRYTDIEVDHFQWLSSRERWELLSEV